jgi:hypothetical protein
MFLFHGPFERAWNKKGPGLSTEFFRIFETLKPLET